MNPKQKTQKRKRRHIRIRAKVKGTASMPRLSVFKSSQHVYAQLVDDDLNGKTLVSASSLELKKKIVKIMAAGEVGRLIAKKAQAKKIGKVVFDRSGFKYHGRIKALAEAARKAGLKF